MIEPAGPRTIAVVGGGASGALVVVNLLRSLRSGDAEIVLIDRNGEFGPGIAYSTANPHHRLNVAAARMGAIDGEPEHFLDWLRQRQPGAAEADFVSGGSSASTCASC